MFRWVNAHTVTSGSYKHRALLALVCMCIMCTAGATELVRHRVHVEGQGPVTVIFEAGLGDTLDVWKEVQHRVAGECTRAVAYTRAGYPGSDPPSGARDAATVVAELRKELNHRGIGPPYVLVGHSLGGLYMQYFARQFADEVSGLVLVDSTHWDQQLPVSARGQQLRAGGRTQVLYMPVIMRREFADSLKAGEQVHASPYPGGVPTIVLSSTAALRGETPASRTRAARLQEAIAAEFPAARHIRVAGSGHYIHVEHPDVVSDSVLELAGCPVEGT